MLRWLFLALLLPLAAARAETLRVAVLNAELSREGPGLMLRDILDGDAQVDAAARLIARADPDILLLLRFDYDMGGAALSAFADLLAAARSAYPHRFARRPNAGRATTLDMDGDGYARGARDGQGYGRFAGQNGMAVLSKLPLDAAAARDFSALLWRELPGARLPVHPDGTAFPSPEAQAIQRLFATAAWEVPVLLPGGGRLRLLAFHAVPPVFDGPEDRNGLRNADELRFWRLLLDGALAEPLDLPAPAPPFVLVGNANNDPRRGDGAAEAIAGLLAHRALQDPAPDSAEGREADAPRATVRWDVPDAPPAMRVDYVLPGAGVAVRDTGIVWAQAAEGPAALRHGLVWADIALP